MRPCREAADVQVEMIGGEGRVREEALVLCTPLHSKRKNFQRPYPAAAIDLARRCGTRSR